MPQTYLSMTIRDQEDPTKVIGVIQLLVRANNIRFTEQDVEHLGLLSAHLSQVFSYIQSAGLLTMFTEAHSQVLQRLCKVLNGKYKGHMKHFFRELLAFKFGKINLLKNKIMRKYMDRHMKVDQKLIQKMSMLIEIKEKCNLTQK